MCPDIKERIASLGESPYLACVENAKSITLDASVQILTGIYRGLSDPEKGGTTVSKKRGSFRTKEQREAVCRALGCVAMAGGSLLGQVNSAKIQESFDKTIEAQKWLQIALGIAPKEEYFPTQEAGR